MWAAWLPEYYYSENRGVAVHGLHHARQRVVFATPSFSNLFFVDTPHLPRVKHPPAARETFESGSQSSSDVSRVENACFTRAGVEGLGGC